MNISNNNNNTNTTRESGTGSNISPGTSMSDNCKDGASKSNNDGVCDVNNMLQNMSTADDKDIIVSTCANCGKEDVNNICNKCKMVKYCNAACKKKHRHKHKKECEEHIRLAAERVSKLHDEELFKQPPLVEDCPICFIHLPTSGSVYYACCGKLVCGGCGDAPVYDDQGNVVDDYKCPFCRTPYHETDEDYAKRIKARAELNDPIAIHNLGVYYARGEYGVTRDYTKALELYHRAGELGYAPAYCNIGYAYNNGEGVEVDKKKANHYYELAAIKGDSNARHNLGINEAQEGNSYYLGRGVEVDKKKASHYFNRSIKHFMIDIGSGSSKSLNKMKELYLCEYATKDDYMKALQTYQVYLSENKCVQRDEAAVADDE